MRICGGVLEVTHKKVWIRVFRWDFNTVLPTIDTFYFALINTVAKVEWVLFNHNYIYEKSLKI